MGKEMNERMTQLADQARKKPMGDSWCYTSAKEFEQKFAELIVQECASKVDFILRERRDGGGTMGDKIREHFGVEE